MSQFIIPAGSDVATFMQDITDRSRDQDAYARVAREKSAQDKEDDSRDKAAYARVAKEQREIEHPSTNRAAKGVSSFIQDLKKAAPQIALVAAVTPTITDFMKGLLEPFSQIGEAVTEMGLTTSEGFEEMVTDVSDEIYALQPIAEQVGSWIGGTYDLVQAKDWEGLKDRIETGFDESWDAMIGLINADGNWTDLRSGITTGLDTAWGAITGFFADTSKMEDIGAFAANIVNGVADFLGGITTTDWETIFDGIKTGMTTFYEELNYPAIMVGVVNGFATLGEVLITSLIEGMQNALIAHTPDNITEEEWLDAILTGLQGMSQQ